MHGFHPVLVLGLLIAAVLLARLVITHLLEHQRRRTPRARAQARQPMDPAGPIPEPVASVSSPQADPAPCLGRAAPVTSRSDMRRFFSRRSWMRNRHALQEAIVVAAILGPPVGAGPGRATDHRIEPGRGRERHD